MGVAIPSHLAKRLYSGGVQVELGPDLLGDQTGLLHCTSLVRHPSHSIRRMLGFLSYKRGHTSYLLQEEISVKPEAPGT